MADFEKLGEKFRQAAKDIAVRPNDPIEPQQPACPPTVVIERPRVSWHFAVEYDRFDKIVAVIARPIEEETP